jgi:hypothetical protein
MIFFGFKDFYFRQAIFLNGIQWSHAKSMHNGNRSSYFSHF